MNFENLSALDLIIAYSNLLKELSKRKIIRSRNIVGDLGEYLAIEYYNRSPGLPKLLVASPGTQNVDAISRNGERYTIKSMTGNVTGVFYGLPSLGSNDTPKQKFEYLIIVKFDGDYQLEWIIELSWDQFLLYKKWHSRMQAWNIQVTKEVHKNSKIIFQRDLN